MIQVLSILSMLVFNLPSKRIRESQTDSNHGQFRSIYKAGSSISKPRDHHVALQKYHDKKKINKTYLCGWYDGKQTRHHQQ